MKHCMQVAKSSAFPSENDVTDLCWILYNKPCVVPTFFFQRRTAFELFFIYYSTYLHFIFLVLGRQKLKISASRPYLFDR